MLSVPGLFLKLNKGLIIGWFITFIITGASYGSIYGDMGTFLQSNELMREMFTRAGFTIEESFTGTIMMIMAALVAIMSIAIINKLFTQEARLHLSQFYATKITREQLYWTNIIMATIAGIIGIFLSSGVLGATAITAMGGNSKMNLMDFLAAGYNFLPIILFFIGLSAIVFGWIPKLGKFIYVYLGYSFALNYFGNILDLTEWVSKTAIISWIPLMPVEKFNVLIFISISLLSIIFIVLGYIGYIKRDMVEGS